MSSFLSHPLEDEGFLTIEDSLKRSGKGKSLDDVELVVIEPHADETFDRAPESLKPFIDERWKRVARMEHDEGARELAQGIVRRVPNSLMVGVNLNRVIADANRENVPEHALGGFNRLIGPDADPALVQEVMSLHGRVLGGLNALLAQLRPGTKIQLAHTMYPEDPEDWDAADAIDLTTMAGVDKWVEAFEAPVRANRTGLVRPEVCTMTQFDGERPLDDVRARTSLEQVLAERGLRAQNNDPYGTKLGRHMTSRWQTNFPGQAIAWDVREDTVCKGNVADGSFTVEGRRVDQDKVNGWVDIFTEAIKRSRSEA